MAEALAQLGLQRAVVVHGHGGLDEASLSGPSELRLVEQGVIRRLQLDPLAMGLGAAPLEALVGGDLETNRQILETVLRGSGSAAQRDVVALNTALVLWASGRAPSLQEGLDQARASLASEAAWQRLLVLRQALDPLSAEAAAP
jgi:anthranilate phosphoribosyltransferase